MRVVTLTAPGRSGITPTQAIAVTRDVDGRFYLASRSADSVLVFDARGRFDRELKAGLQGAFRMITNILPVADGGIEVYDTISRTLTVFDRVLRPQSTTSLRLRPTFALGSDRYIHAEQIRTASAVGQPVHLITRSGDVERSFGSPSPYYRHDQPLVYERIAAAGADGDVWLAAQGRYSLERWNPQQGLRLAVLPIESTWFREALDFSSPTERPASILESMWQPYNVVWILLRDADPRWLPQRTAPSDAKAGLGYYNARYDSVLEVVDSVTGAVIASMRTDHALWGGRGETPLLATARFSAADDTVSIDVSVPVLVDRKD